MPTRMLFRFSDGEREWLYGDDDPQQPGDTLVINGRALSIETVEPDIEGAWLVTLSPAEPQTDG